MADGRDGTMSLLPSLFWTAAAAFFLFCFLRATVAGDIWFLLLAGNYVLENGQVPNTNFFLYTWHGQKDLFGGWGFGLLAAIAYQIADLAGILWLNALLWSGVVVIGLMASRLAIGTKIFGRLMVSEQLALAATSTITLLAVIDRSWLRPEVTLYLFWVSGICLFEWARRSNRMLVAQVIFPLMVWLEAWFHTAGLILLLLPVAYAAENIAEFFQGNHYTFQRARAVVSPWLFSLAMCVSLPLLNPYGAFQVYGQLILFLNNFSAGTSWLVQRLFPLTEWQHLVVSGGMSEFLPTWVSEKHTMLFSLHLCLSIGIFTITKRKIWFVVQALPLALLAMLHIRGVGIFGIGLLVPLAAGIYSMLTRTPAQTFLKLFPFLALLVMNIGLSIVVARANSGWMLPTNEQPLPAATSALKAALPDGSNIFTTHYLGAIVAWSLGKNYKVPISAHMMVLPPDVKQHYRSIVTAQPTWQSELSKHQVKAIVIEPVEKNAGTYAKLLPQLLYGSDWRLIAVDKDALTFLQLNEVDVKLSDQQKLNQAEKAWTSVIENIIRYNLSNVAAKTVFSATASLTVIDDQLLTADAKIKKLKTLAEN